MPSASSLDMFLSMQELIGALCSWGLTGPPQQMRHWTISQWERDKTKVSLSWRVGDSQLGGIDKVSFNVGEAIFLALEEFRAWQASY